VTTVTPLVASLAEERDIEDLLTVGELAQKLGCKPALIYYWIKPKDRHGKVRKDPLPHIMLGRYPRFEWKAVSQWLGVRKVGYREAGS
jgi:predicted DNA-binding transcriptional regulator AlpA